jgi:hypothetical protein
MNASNPNFPSIPNGRRQISPWTTSVALSDHSPSYVALSTRAPTTSANYLRLYILVYRTWWRAMGVLDFGTLFCANVIVGLMAFGELTTSCSVAPWQLPRQRILPLAQHYWAAQLVLKM